MASYEDKKTKDRDRIAAKRKQEKLIKSQLSQNVASCRDKSQMSHIQITDNKITNTKKKYIKKKAIQFPSNFKITPEMQTWFAAQKFSINIQKETTKFKNHALANARTQVDWIAAWRNWMLKAQEYIKTDQKETPETVNDIIQKERNA